MVVKLSIMNSMVFDNYLTELQNAISLTDISLISSQSSLVARLIIQANKSGKSTAIFGNGGSSSDANHWVGELVCSYKDKSRPPINAISLSSNMPIITAWSNDICFDTIFSRQVEALSSNLAVAIGLSTSGSSSNVIKGLSTASHYGCHTILITGNTYSTTLSDINTVVSFHTSNTPIIQSLTTAFFHSVCDEIDNMNI